MSQLEAFNMQEILNIINQRERDIAILEDLQPEFSKSDALKIRGLITGYRAEINDLLFVISIVENQSTSPSPEG